MTLQTKIETTLRAMPNDPVQAAIAICRLLDDASELKALGRFNADGDHRAQPLPRRLSSAAANHWDLVASRFALTRETCARCNRERAVPVLKKQIEYYMDAEFGALVDAAVPDDERAAIRTLTLERLVELWRSAPEHWARVTEDVDKELRGRLRAAAESGTVASVEDELKPCLDHAFSRTPAARDAATAAYERAAFGTVVRALMFQLRLRTMRFWWGPARQTRQNLTAHADTATTSLSSPPSAASVSDDLILASVLLPGNTAQTLPGVARWAAAATKRILDVVTGSQLRAYARAFRWPAPPARSSQILELSIVDELGNSHVISFTAGFKHNFNVEEPDVPDLVEAMHMVSLITRNLNMRLELT